MSVIQTKTTSVPGRLMTVLIQAHLFDNWAQDSKMQTWSPDNTGLVVGQTKRAKVGIGGDRSPMTILLKWILGGHGCFPLQGALIQTKWWYLCNCKFVTLRSSWALWKAMNESYLPINSESSLGKMVPQNLDGQLWRMASVHESHELAVSWVT